MKNALDWGLSGCSLFSSQGKYHLIFILGAYKTKDRKMLPLVESADVRNILCLGVSGMLYKGAACHLDAASPRHGYLVSLVMLRRRN